MFLLVIYKTQDETRGGVAEGMSGLASEDQQVFNMLGR